MGVSNEPQALAGAAQPTKRSAEELESDLTKKVKTENDLPTPNDLGSLRTSAEEWKFRSETRRRLAGRVSLLYYELEWSKADMDTANNAYDHRIQSLLCKCERLDSELMSKDWKIVDLNEQVQEWETAQRGLEKRYSAAVNMNERLVEDMEALKNKHKKATDEIETLKEELVRAKAETCKEENRKLFWIGAHKSQAEYFRENRYLVGLPPSDGQLGHDP